MADTSQPVPAEPIRVTVAAAVAAGELRQLANGKPGAYRGNYGISSGNDISYWPKGQYVVPKTTGIVLLDGGRAYWDRSARKVTFRKNGDRDFFLGTVIGDAASADESCTVLFGEEPYYDYDLLKGPATSSVPIGTQALPGTPSAIGFFGYPFVLGGTHVLNISGVNEAQRLDLWAMDKFDPVNANAIIELQFQRLDSVNGSVVDFNIGIASGTHATDFDAIDEYLALHMDSDSSNIYLQSKDGTNTVAATDTLTDMSAFTFLALANIEEWWFDLRNPASVAIYRNGVRVLPGTTFNISAAASNWFLIVHMEKTAALGSAMSMAIARAQARTAEQ